jgi:hypothetical protein
MHQLLLNNIHTTYMLCLMIEFDSRTGYLPGGVHRMALRDVGRQFAWNARRRLLFGGLARAVSNLQFAGCRAVIVDGSFVTAKEEPGDWDAAFDPVGVSAKRLDPILIKHDDGRRAMRAKYLGDIFPWTALASSTTGSIYQQFFQKDRDGTPKGIVEISLQAIQ